MALTVEDGSVVTGADSYVSEADFVTYGADHGLSGVATATTAEREAALRRATRDVDDRRWTGYLLSNAWVERLAWPRSGVIDAHGRTVPSSTIPQAVIDATCERAAGLLAIDAAEAAGTLLGAADEEVEIVGAIRIKTNLEQYQNRQNSELVRGSLAHISRMLEGLAGTPGQRYVG